MKKTEFVSAATVRRFNRVMESSGFLAFDGNGQGAYVANLLSRYPGHEAAVAAALDRAVNRRWPTEALGALDAVDLQTAPEIR